MVTEMKSVLYFSIGSMEGFTSVLADKQENYTTPIRELLQNSLDAFHGKRRGKIDIYIETIKTSAIPHIKEYKEALKKSIKTQDDKNSYNENSKQRVKFIKDALQENELQVLMFVDNGSGMSVDTLDGLLNGRSVDKNAQSAGSFGVGHLASYSLSSLRYVLYATKHEDSSGKIQNLFTGSPILAGHSTPEANRSGTGSILKQEPKNPQKPEPDFPVEFPDFIQQKMDLVEKTGSLVAILGLSKEWNEEAEYAIVSNYFYAIKHNNLSITIHRNGEEREISATDEVERLIASKKDQKIRKKENILSGKSVYQAWQAVPSTNLKKIPISNGEKIHVYIKNDETSDSVIVLVRNGMVVARHDSMLSPHIKQLRKNSDYEPFTAVIAVDSQNAKNLFSLVKGSENPHHNELNRDLLSKAREEELKKCLEELSEGIKVHLDKIDRNSFNLSWFGMPAVREAQTIGGRILRQSDQAVPQNVTRPRRDKKGNGTGKKTGRKVPTVHPRQLIPNNATRYKDEGGQWIVSLRITHNNSKSKNESEDDVYLSIYLGEDNDDGKLVDYLNFLEVSVDGKKVQVGDEKNQVKLGHLKSGETYDVVTTVQKPAKIGDMKVPLSPIFGLKQRKKPVTPTTETTASKTSK